MASIVKTISLGASAAEVWDALADFGALHRRLVPGFVTACEFDGTARTITFSNGSTARELLVTIDGDRRRVVYAIAPNERIQHYGGSAQVADDGKGGAVLTWIVDVLPNEIAPYINSQMQLGVASMQTAFAKKAS